MKNLFSFLAIAAVALALPACSTTSACKACCKDKCAECCKDDCKSCCGKKDAKAECSSCSQ
jgi:hypothetical protein